MPFLTRDGDLVAFWKSQAAITSVVGSGDNAKIYKRRAKAGVEPPYVVFFVEAGESYRHHKGVSEVKKAVVHVYCFGTIASPPDSLASAIRDATEPKQEELMGSTFVSLVLAVAPEDGDEIPFEGSDVGRPWTRIVFTFVYQ